MFEKAIGYEWIEEQAFKLKTIEYGENGKKLRESEDVKVVEVVKRLPPDTAATIFWLRNRQPQLWGRDGSAAPLQNEDNPEATRLLSEHYAKMAAKYEHPGEADLKNG